MLPIIDGLLPLGDGCLDASLTFFDEGAEGICRLLVGRLRSLELFFDKCLVAGCRRRQRFVEGSLPPGTDSHRVFQRNLLFHEPGQRTLRSIAGQGLLRGCKRGQGVVSLGRRWRLLLLRAARAARLCVDDHARALPATAISGPPKQHCRCDH